MAEQRLEQPDVGDDSVVTETTESSREPTEFEKRLRRDLARSREQLRIAQAEREAGVALAARERDEAIAAIRSESAARLIRAELKAQALKAGIVDLDGLRLGDMSSLSLDENGSVLGAEILIETLRQEKPYLFADARVGISTGTTGQTLRPPSPAAPSVLDARTLPRDAWQAERQRLLGGRH
ncbi:hypothetical protein [Lichenicoccus sp.]|uniref:phage scaffolding protein n=1 Tax=Lichenicoccus sp. TaxID=2781899 RepID=UPI003D142484